MIDEPNQLLTISEVVDYLKISDSSVRRIIERKDNPIPTIRIADRTVRIRMGDLQKWLKSQKEPLSDNS